MRHFDHLSALDKDRLFHRLPEPFARDDAPGTLAVALGATLYLPATRPTLAADIVKCGARGVTSMVVCLEDSIADHEVGDGEDNLVRQLRSLPDEVPMLFIRVRNPDQIPQLVSRLGGAAERVSGFVLPKFTAGHGEAFLDALADTAGTAGLRLFAMPVIESREAIYREIRVSTLLDVARLLDKHRDRVLAVRLGATDLSSHYGLRRPRELTIYDVLPVAEVISDVVNIIGRMDGSGFTVTGPVWEYFLGGARMFKPQLRETPFVEHDAPGLRQRLITADLDGLIREVHLDKANGLTGKTVIHPSHVAAVHALSVVTNEEYCDAADVLGRAGGVRASSYRNKMNEVKPHTAWAERIMSRARVFGVAAEGVTFVDFLSAEGVR
ncbi:HpcH/HpaI aldolase/citrate lyase family protein [Microbispora sp. NPDC049125]|uniref:HpcH/HpaI aldolase/citrate lyase family protein n=1 Tax=Microbispora sp. NPDC049125 TaxID=3154929 RepID=UPI0034676902